MKLTTAIQANEFIELVEKCEGDVYLKSNEGDVFNLKSKLSQYIAIGRLLDDCAADLELFCDKRSDEPLFFKFFSKNPETA